MSRTEGGGTSSASPWRASSGLACVGFGMVAWGGSNDPQRRAPAPEDPSAAEEVVLSHDDSAPVPTGPVSPARSAPGSSAPSCRCRRPTHPFADRRGHGRLPMLPAGPGAPRGRLAHRHAISARQPRRRAPRHPLPGPRRVSVAAAEARRRSATRGRGVDLLRRHGRGAASPRTWTTRRGSAAWAPGGRETVWPAGSASRSSAAPRSSCRSTTTCSPARIPTCPPPGSGWTPKAAPTSRGVHTTLLPAPVELPCRPSTSSGPLCDRDASVADVQERMGGETGRSANLLHLLCGTDIYASTDAPRAPGRFRRSMTILVRAGHMHLLGQWLTIEVNPGTPEATEVLDIPLWNFDDQGARRIEPLQLDAGDEVRVTCHHTPGAARPAARLRGHAREVRRLGRGHHRRDVPGHPPGHAPEGVVVREKPAGSAPLPPYVDPAPSTDRKGRPTGYP